MLVPLVALLLAAPLLAPQAPRLRDEQPQARKLRLTEECAHRSGWRLVELADYWLLTDVDDRHLLDELARRVALARAATIALLEPLDAAPPAAKSVLCVHARLDLFHFETQAYGVTGVYDRDTTRIVLYAGVENGGPRQLFRTAQSMVACEVLDTQLRDVPSMWFIAGVQDWIAAHELVAGKLRPAPNPDRLELIRDDLRCEHFVPLREFVRFGAAQFFAQSRYGTDIGDHWAQSWALVAWLLEPGSARCVDGKRIFARYLLALRESHDAAVASSFAFQGVEWPRLESDWKRAVLGLRIGSARTAR